MTYREETFTIWAFREKVSSSVTNNSLGKSSDWPEHFHVPRGKRLFCLGWKGRRGEQESCDVSVLLRRGLPKVHHSSRPTCDPQGYRGDIMPLRRGLPQVHHPSQPTCDSQGYRGISVTLRRGLPEVHHFSWPTCDPKGYRDVCAPEKGSAPGPPPLTAHV